MTIKVTNNDELALFDSALEWAAAPQKNNQSYNCKTQLGKFYFKINY